MRLVAQSQTEWCWAACACMVFDYYGKPALGQCDLAEFLFATTTCCSAPATCNNPCSRADFVKVLGHNGASATYHATSVAFSTIQTETGAGRPIAVAYLYSPAGGAPSRHLVIVHGWSSVASGTDVLVSDPKAGVGVMAYSHLLTAAGLGTWDATWTDVA